MSAETYIELFRNTIHGNHGKHRIRNISRDAGKSTDLLWEVEHGQPASDLSAKEKRFWKVTADKAQEVCEIRLRVDRPVIIETSRGDFFLDHSGIWREEPYGAYSVTETEIRDLIAYLCQDSVYAYADEIRQGFLTVEGGHRIGLSGQAVLEMRIVCGH